MSQGSLFDPNLYNVGEGGTLLSRLAGLAVGSLQTGVGFALGVAAAPALQPLATSIGQEAWSLDPSRAVDATTAAQIVAEAVELQEWGVAEAGKHGINKENFLAILGEVLNGPGMAELLQALRRGTITPDQFAHGLRKAKLETLWDDALADLQHERLDPSALATAIHRGIIAGQGLIVTEPPTGAGVIPRVPESSIDAVAEAKAQGYDPERLRVLVGNTGLPLSLGEMLTLRNRNVVTDVDVKRSVAQSNVRNEYMDVALELRRRLLTPHEYEEAALRGVLTNAAADAGAELSGMTAEDARILFEILGRPEGVHAITTGLARGGEYGGTYDDIPEPYRDAVRRSSIRPEYARLAYANRYTIPSYFILRAILNDNGMTPAEFADYGKQLGWPPELADKAAAALGGGAGAKADPHVAKADTQVWNALHKSYVEDSTDDALAERDLATIGVAASSIAVVLSRWKVEREIVRRTLTPTEIRKAVGQPGKDRAWALERLLELGYDQADAETFLAE